MLDRPSGEECAGNNGVTTIWKRVVLCILVFCFIADAGRAYCSDNVAREGEKDAIVPEVVAGGGQAFALLAESLLEKLPGNESARVRCESWADEKALARVVDGRAQAYLGWEDRSNREKALVSVRMQMGCKPPCRVVLGVVGAMVVVSSKSDIRMLSIGKLSDMLAGGERRESESRRGGQGLRRLYSVGAHSLLSQVLLSKVMRVENGRMIGYRRISGDVVSRESADSVCRDVASSRVAVGIVPLVGTPLPRGVRAVPIIGDGGECGIEPSVENAVNGSYPICRRVAMFVREDACPVINGLMEVAILEDGVGVLRRQGVLTRYDELAYLAKERLSAFRSGKGQRLLAIGVAGGPTPFRDLATEYVRAKAVVQLSYKPIYEDLPAIGDFVGGGAGMRELLFLADGPSARAMAVHGEKWKALGSTSLTTSGGDANGGSTSLTTSASTSLTTSQPAGTGPAEHLLAGRAVAVIVNPANKLSSLSLKQLRDIFGGKVKDWNAIGSTGLTASGDGKSQIKKCQIKAHGPRTDDPAAGNDGKSEIEKSQIKAYGLRTDDPATAVFEKECLSRYKWGRVLAKKDTAAAVAAVSMDPQAIAYVDLLAIPGLTPASLAGSFAAAGQNVKVLAIKPISQAAPVLPTPTNIKIGTYPLSQRLYVYVHPKASATARDFVKFIATCGASEATPYADTVKSVMDTYSKHNLVSLAPAAIQRITKEAKAVAEKAKAAAAAKAKTAKPKRNRKRKPAPNPKAKP